MFNLSMPIFYHEYDMGSYHSRRRVLAGAIFRRQT